jgi:hypothetical protein
MEARQPRPFKLWQAVMVTLEYEDGQTETVPGKILQYNVSKKGELGAIVMLDHRDRWAVGPVPISKITAREV